MLFFSIIFSFIGLGYYYGKKNEFEFRLAGIALMLFPYFISRVWLLISIGLVLIILPIIWVKLN
jgi:hypothetical protein